MPVRVFIVDDSAVVRRVVGRLLAEKYGIEVVGTAADGRQALAALPDARPDVVVLDVEMPVLNGLDTLREIMRRRPLPVVMLSAHTTAGSKATVEALALGAVDFVPKGVQGGLTAMVDELAAKVRLAAGVPRETLHKPWRRESRPRYVAPVAAERPGLVVIGCSTGGPAALRVVVPALPAGLPAAVVVVQHMPPGFTRTLAEHLAGLSALEVRQATDGDPVAPGQVLVAPAGMHFRFRAGADGARAAVEPGTGPLPPGGFRPSVDEVMTSAAEVFGPRTVGVLLTGMGRDGARGMAAIRQQGGRTVAEDESTCVVYGMPRAAVEAGAAEKVLPLPEIPGEIVRLAAAVSTQAKDS
ncbi:MAG: protein-glutamate methylesterase/protein-glutamine glutaminase [Desulfotomaculales bacterium]